MVASTKDMQLPANIWSVPVYLPSLQPRLTARAVAAAEKKLGVRLPLAYVEALRVQNGGHLRRTSHPSGGVVDCIAGIGPRFPSILGCDWRTVKATMAELGFTTPAQIDDLIPFCGDGHYYYCLDYRRSGRSGEPSVTYVDVECFDKDEVLAPDFLTFLHQLRADESRVAFGLCTSARMATVAAALSKATGFAFEDQGDQNHGYRTFCATLPGRADPAWLQPNEVKRGFVRRSDRRNAHLRDLLPGRAYRYPEHADCRYFVVTDFATRAGQKIMRALEKLPFVARRVELDGE